MRRFKLTFDFQRLWHQYHHSRTPVTVVCSNSISHGKNSYQTRTLIAGPKLAIPKVNSLVDYIFGSSNLYSKRTALVMCTLKAYSNFKMNIMIWRKMKFMGYFLKIDYIDQSLEDHVVSCRWLLFLHCWCVPCLTPRSQWHQIVSWEPQHYNVGMASWNPDIINPIENNTWSMMEMQHQNTWLCPQVVLIWNNECHLGGNNRHLRCKSNKFHV